MFNKNISEIVCLCAQFLHFCMHGVFHVPRLWNGMWVVNSLSCTFSSQSAITVTCSMSSIVLHCKIMSRQNILTHTY